MESILTLKQISNYISGVFEDELILHDICVSGEIFEYKQSGNNTFIVLKEDDIILECYKYGKLETFQKGAKVQVRGRIKYYSKASKISLSILEIKHTGEGQLHADFLKLKEKLASEGMFENKTKLPSFIKNVAIITSSEGAVIYDFMSVVSKAHGYMGVKVYDVSVQGDNAKNEIVSAISKANKCTDINVDVIVIARGGGSSQDLLPFNTEEVARAVYNSKIPIISAVGHETDYSLCDFCSTLRAPTPSLAAESIVQINGTWLSNIYSLLTRLSEQVENKLLRRQNYVSVLTRRLAHKNEVMLGSIENKIVSRLKDIYVSLASKHVRNNNTTQQRVNLLVANVQKLYTHYERAFGELNAKLDVLSPLKLLSGGYARVYEGGEVIKSVSQTRAGQNLKIAFSDGQIEAKVITKDQSKVTAKEQAKVTAKEQAKVTAKEQAKVADKEQAKVADKGEE